MFQNDDIFTDYLIQWVNSANKTQLRFISFGLLCAIKQCKMNLPEIPENRASSDALAYGLLLAAAAKENCREELPPEKWIGLDTPSDVLYSFLMKFGSF